MSLRAKLLSASGGVDKLYVDDVFSAYTYTGTGATQTITNGIDLAGKGGLVWIKNRSNPGTLAHELFDTNRGALNQLISSSSAAQSSLASSLTGFSSNGFALGAEGNVNGGTSTFASWTFRKAPKFFDVVTYTGNGVAGRQIPHSLGIAPGMVIVKRTNSAGSWRVWHTATGTNNTLQLDTTAALLTANTDYVRTADVAAFTVGPEGDVNLSGGIYVAYLFAHDPSADGVIQCGSATEGTTVTLGWEPQFVLIKRRDSSTLGQWTLIDVMRDWSYGSTTAKHIEANTSTSESNGIVLGKPTTTGFTVSMGTGSGAFIYLAIRRPNKPPTSGTQVYNAIARTGTGGTYSNTGAGFAPDLVVSNSRNSYGARSWFDRLRGGSKMLLSNSTAAEGTDTSLTSFDIAGFTATSSVPYTNDTGQTYSYNFFKRAPGVFDVVCYTGDGVVGRAISHNLGAAPELMIVKARNNSAHWGVYYGDSTKYLYLQTIDAAATSSMLWNNTAPTAAVFTVGAVGAVNVSSAYTYVAYLFATKAGISKVFNYTGNGSSQTINCGFTTGARFILIKRTDSAGDWYVWDTVRGIIAGNDPHLSLNTTAAEVTTNDSIDPDSSGFIVNQVAATNINVTSATYIGLALA